MSYWGSACPQNGLTFTMGSLNTTTSTLPLTFTLANFLPALGSFGSSLRMCDIVSTVVLPEGWKVTLNARGTTASGNAALPGNATMFLRGTYAFAQSAEIQSIGMLDVTGPLTGLFARRLTPEEGDKGAVAPCGGGELDIEFQARAVQDSYPPWGNGMQRRAVNETSWTLSTDVEVSKC
ncbi:hypothetical protein N0V90_013000 [Kalmusia sp. IMI 367209]|nr:hypothetical protein N0V90_013000 [Kalmusia sp. IMI 367209]